MAELLPPIVRRVLAPLACVAAVVALTGTVPADAGTGAVRHPAAAAATDPLAGGPWGIYKGNDDGLWPAYQHAKGNNKKLLAREALEPRLRRYGGWIPTSKIGSLIRSDIAQERAGNANTLTWIEIFRLWPNGEGQLHTPLTAAQQADYKHWINAAAAAIGNARVGMLLEHDLPLAAGGWNPSVHWALVRYAAQKFSRLPNTTVYLDAGSSDWLSVPQMTSILEKTNVKKVRGFALGSSHRVSVASELRYGKAIATRLQKQGYGRHHFIIDTSDNGHPFTNAQFYAKYPHGNVTNPPACRTMSQHVCVSLGIPPTTDVANPRWKLSATLDRIARSWCDAYEWDGKPWKVDNDATFSLSKALQVARTDPFA